MHLELSNLDKDWLEDLSKKVINMLNNGGCQIDELATSFFMSRTKFFNKVKALTGTTPAVFVREIRLDLAYEKVKENPNQSFSSIAASLGMIDAKHFKKMFIKKFGVGPKDLRL